MAEAALQASDAAALRMHRLLGSTSYAEITAALIEYEGFDEGEAARMWEELFQHKRRLQDQINDEIIAVPLGVLLWHCVMLRTAKHLARRYPRSACLQASLLRFKVVDGKTNVIHAVASSRKRIGKDVVVSQSLRKFKCEWAYLDAATADPK